MLINGAGHTSSTAADEDDTKVAARRSGFIGQTDVMDVAQGFQ